MRDAFPTGTLTFLFTDIEGSTARWEHYTATVPNDRPVLDVSEPAGNRRR